MGIDLEKEFLLEEVDYVMGRFPLHDLETYLTAERTGRGTSPRVERTLRHTIIESVIKPYMEWLQKNGLWDWNTLAYAMSQNQHASAYDVVIVDEAQDFSATQLRAIKSHLADPHSVTFILDTIQRIYARGFTWAEAGFIVRPENVRKLSVNYRNTKQIAAFARGVLTGLALDADSAMPDFNSCTREGEAPIVLNGRYQDQLRWIMAHLNTIDLTEESVAFLSPKGWLNDISNQLARLGIPFAKITRRSDWPKGSEAVALSTMHSAKGLEFDHVFMIGLNREIMDEGGRENDDKASKARRLLAMAVGRAKKSVVIGYKLDQEPLAMQYPDSSTYRRVML